MLTSTLEAQQSRSTNHSCNRTLANPNTLFCFEETYEPKMYKLSARRRIRCICEIPNTYISMRTHAGTPKRTAPKRPHDASKCLQNRFQGTPKQPNEASKYLQDHFQMPQASKQYHTRLKDSKYYKNQPSNLTFREVGVSFPMTSDISSTSQCPK